MPRSNQNIFLAGILMLVLLLSLGCDKNDTELPDTPIIFTGKVYLNSANAILSAKFTQTKIKNVDRAGFIISQIRDEGSRSFFILADTIINNTFKATLSGSLTTDSKYEVSAVFYIGNTQITGNKVYFTGLPTDAPQILYISLPNETSWGDTIKIVFNHLGAFTSDYSIIALVRDREYEFPTVGRRADTLLVKINSDIPSFHPLIHLKYFDAVVDESYELRLTPPRIDSLSPDTLVPFDNFSILGKNLMNINFEDNPEIQFLKNDQIIFRSGGFGSEDYIHLEIFDFTEPGEYNLRIQYLDTISNSIPVSLMKTEIDGIYPKVAFYGDKIHIKGRWFPNGLSATIDNRFVMELYRDRDLMIYQIPTEWELNNIDGYFNIFVSNLFYDGLNNGFFIKDSIQLKKPIIHSISSNEGLVGSKIILSGDYFSENSHPNYLYYSTVWFNDIRAVVEQTSKTSITARVPFNAPLNSEVRVKNNGVTAVNTKNFSLKIAEIASLSTTDAQPGSSLKINGVNFPENKREAVYYEDEQYVQEKPIHVFFDGYELEIIEASTNQITIRFNSDIVNNTSKPLIIKIGTQEIISTQNITYTTPQ